VSEVILFLVLAATSLLVAAPLGRRASAASLALLASLAFLLFLVFKHGFVRHDVHALAAWATLFATSMVTLVSRTDLRSRPRAGARPRSAHALLAARLVVGAAALVCLGSWSELPERRPLGAEVTTAVVELPRAVRRAIALLFGDGHRRFEVEWSHQLAAIAAANPIPSVTGPVDLYGSEQTLVVAHGLDWRPRPVFQSYSAYTPWLLNLNARHVEERGAGTLLFALRPQDGRLPAAVDGPSWPVILSHYVVGERAGGYLALRRMEPPGRVRRTLLAERTVSFDEVVEVPQVPPGALVWAEIEVPPSTIGRLVSVVWKPPIVYIRPLTDDGVEHFYSLPPEISEAGFILSPFIQTTDDVAALAAALPDGPIPLPVVQSFRMTTARAADFGPISVRFERMTIAPPTPRHREAERSSHAEAP
jgi:hypothetical protein